MFVAETNQPNLGEDVGVLFQPISGCCGDERGGRSGGPATQSGAERRESDCFQAVGDGGFERRGDGGAHRRLRVSLVVRGDDVDHV